MIGRSGGIVAKRLGYTKRDIKNINITIGLNLAAARRNAGMTQTDVMQAVWGVSNNRNRISEIENGKKDLTLIDLLVFQNLYGQSLDYICGLSTEPEVDMLAGTVNHIVNQSRNMIELLTTELAEVMVSHVKSISKNDHAALLMAAKEVVSARQPNVTETIKEPDLYDATMKLRQVVRHVEVKQARQAQAVDTQMMQIKERVDKEDKHRLVCDIDKHYQYSIPLTPPEELDESVAVGVNYG